jgi:hypothetical protein
MCVAVVAWKVGWAAYDGYQAYRTFQDPNATREQKAMAVGEVVSDITGIGTGKLQKGLSAVKGVDLLP